MTEAPWWSVCEFEINVFYEQINSDESFSIFTFAEDRGVVADSINQIRRVHLRRPLSNDLYELELALHLSERRISAAHYFILPQIYSHDVLLNQQIQRLPNYRPSIEIHARTKTARILYYLQSERLVFTNVCGYFDH